jgi:hypothetical protein
VGWEPQTFKSTRDERAEKYKSTADDYMDDEVTCLNILIFYTHNLGSWRIWFCCSKDSGP